MSPPLVSFSQLGLPDDAVDHLTRRGFSTPFPVQELAIPAALEGRDVSGRAPTGSGKTLAFGLPLALRVTRAKPRRPRALVLVPTRELADQIQRELRPLLGLRKRSVATFYGGVGFGPQFSALRRGVDVAVACPGRLADLIQRREVDLSAVEIVVLDEADRMADMGFLPEVRRILDQVRSDRQTLLFSATLDGDVDELVKRYQSSPEFCDVGGGTSEVDTNVHEFVNAERHKRVDMAAYLIAEHGSTVVFCRTKHGADRVARQLERHGLAVECIHGGRSQAQRARALDRFSRGRSVALVATDVAARGIHVEGVACVIHLDLAGDQKDYLHRSGRTGRAGSTGIVITFVTDADVAKARKLRSALKVDVAWAAPPRSKGPGRQGSRATKSSRPERNRNESRNRSRPEHRRANSKPSARRRERV